jgi:mycoredoxin
MYTTSTCGDCVVTRKHLERLNIEFEEINIEHDPAAAEYVMQVNGGRRSVPTLVCDGEATSLSRFERSRFDEFIARHGLLARGSV